MAFGIFKKKEDDEIPEDIGFETPPTLANPTAGFQNTNNQMPPLNNNMPNLPPLPGPQTQNNNPRMNFGQQVPNNNQYHPPYQPVQQQTYNPDVENQIKLLQAKVESINVQLNTISQKLDYIINVLRSQGYKF